MVLLSFFTIGEVIMVLGEFFLEEIVCVFGDVIMVVILL